MAAHSPRPTDSEGTTRRGFLERGAAATGAVVTLGVGGSAVAPQFSPVGRAQAIACGGLCIGAAAAGTGVAVGWALGEWDPLESDSPPEGLSPDALGNQILTAAQKRDSDNASTFIDNQTIAESGLEHSLYADGKIAGIESLNAQDPQSDVESAASDEALAQGSTVIGNFLKSWNESLSELESFLTSSNDHPDVSRLEFFTYGDDWYNGGHPPDDLNDIQITETTVTLPDGSDFALKEVMVEVDNNNNLTWARWSPLSLNTGGDYPDELESPESWGVIVSDGDTQANYLVYNDWNAVYQTLNQTVSDVSDGLILWVDGVYGEVQSGELNTEDLLTPSELAEMSADEENINQAIADLMALNIPVDLDREATISVESENETATLSGMLAATTPPADGIVSGETYDPASMNGDIYFDYDISQGSAVWTSYEAAVDGGVVTFTSEPYEGTLFRINTTDGEQATVAASDFEPDSEDNPTEWTVDISDQVDNAITEIDEVEMVAESGDTQYQTIILDQPFTVEKIENSDGKEADSMEFSNSEPQSDDNYITEEEWQAMQEQNQELIDKYEESKNDDSGSIIGDPSALAEEYGGAVAGLVIIVGAVSVVAGIVTGWIPGMGD